MPRILSAAPFAVLFFALTLSAQTVTRRGAREPAWAPDGKRLAFSYLDRIWISGPDGRNGKMLRQQSTEAERDPAWSPDGKSLVIAADSGQGFNLVVLSSSGNGARRLTSLRGDERWPSWTAHGQVIFSYRESGRWQLFAVPAEGGEPRPLFGDTAEDNERHGRVSPDGNRIAYVSDREGDDGDTDLWIAELKPGPRDRVTRTRLLRARGLEGFPSWSPDGSRLAFFGIREGVGSVWVVGVEDPVPPADAVPVPPVRPAETNCC